MNNSNIVKNHLSAGTITELLNGSIAAIVINNFYPQNLCSLISKKWSNRARKGLFSKDDGPSKISMSFCKAMDPKSFSNCSNAITESTSQLRKMFHPHQSPTELLQPVLEEVWSTRTPSNKTYGSGCLVKVYGLLEKNGHIRPHSDDFHRDCQASSPSVQLAAHIYMNAPKKGEELKLCFREPNNPKQEQLRENTGTFFVSQNQVNLISLVLKPKQGDLILFNIRSYYKTNKIIKRPAFSILMLSAIKSFLNFLWHGTEQD